MPGCEGLLTNLTKNIKYFIISFNLFQSIKNKNMLNFKRCPWQRTWQSWENLKVKFATALNMINGIY